MMLNPGTSCGCCNPCHPVTICLRACLSSGATNVTVQIPSLGLSGVTNSAGCVTFVIPVADNYTVTTTGNGRYASTMGTYLIGCGSRLTIDVPAAQGYVCCSCFTEPIPQVLNYSFDGVTGTIPVGPTCTWSFCVSKSVTTILYPSTACAIPFDADPCVIAPVSVSAAFALGVGLPVSLTCGLSQATWRGPDCNNTDGACIGLSHPYVIGTCYSTGGGTVLGANFPAAGGGPCDCIWTMPGLHGQAFYGNAVMINEQQTFAGPLPVPVNLSFAFSGDNLFQNCDIFE